jgi:transposase
MDEHSEEQARKTAIQLHNDGVSPVEIYTRLDRSKRWFFKWLRRYKSGNEDWYKELSRAPGTVANKTVESVEKSILAARTRLESLKYAQVGSLAIQWELKRMGIEPPPTWTIDRVLKRSDAVREKKKYKPSEKVYPDVKRIFSESIQQADFLGPRYIKNDGRFYSMNVFDTQSYLAAINPCRTKGDEDVALSLLRSWKTIGLPDYLQLDNELSFRGSNRYPRSLGLVLRMCLALGVQVIFIPVAEPWRNGHVEKFQDVFDKSFYRQQFFTSFDHLKKEAKVFERFRNNNHRCTGIHSRTPAQHVKAEDIKIDKLDRDVHLKNIDLSLADGYIHLIRFIRSDLKLGIFSEKFKMPKSIQYEYVIATICTDIHQLQVRKEGQIVEAFEYKVPFEYSSD